MIKTPENLDIYLLVKKYGSYKGLLNFIKVISEKKIKKLNLKYKYLFAYCRSQYTAATIRILNRYGYSIDGVIDDNTSFRGSNFLKYKTIDSPTFFKKFRKKLNKVAVVITHQRVITLNKIYEQLKKKGLVKNQIFTIKY